MTSCLNLAISAVEGSPADDPDPPVSLAEMYVQLRLDPTGSPPSHPDDDLIDLAVLSATDELCDAEGNGWLGRALMARTYRMALDRFPTGLFQIPLPPLIEVVGITYTDGDGVEQTVDPSTYTVNTNGSVAKLYPAFGQYWPQSVRTQPGNVVVTFRAGYETADRIPAPIRQWIKARAGFYYENREAIITGTISTELPAFPTMLENLRVRGLLNQ